MAKKRERDRGTKERKEEEKWEVYRESRRNRTYVRGVQSERERKDTWKTKSKEKTKFHHPLQIFISQSHAFHLLRQRASAPARSHIPLSYTPLAVRLPSSLV